MSKKKKRNRPQQPVPSPSPIATPRNEGVTGDLNFDAMEDKIRGDEILLKEDSRKAREAQALKKKMKGIEVDRRLQELRKQLGLKK